MDQLISQIFGTSLPVIIIIFLSASAITVMAAIKLAYFGDGIAESTNLGHSLVGIILLSAATSLPELFSSSSASYIGNVDLAFGNVFGSNMTNIFILVIMDFLSKKRPILLDASQKNVMTGGVVIVVTAIALMMIYMANIPAVKHIDFWFFSPIIVLFYFGGMGLVYRYESASPELPKSKPVSDKPGMSKQKAILGFIAASVVVFSSAILLSYSCDKLSLIKINGEPLGGTFVGTLFMAFTTSLPEIVVSVAAIRLGSHDMALGNLFGSNLFNLAILSFSDGFYRLGKFARDEQILKDAFTLSHPNHLITGLIGLIFIGVVLSSLMLRDKKKYGPLGFDTITIAILYIMGLYLLFILR